MTDVTDVDRALFAQCEYLSESLAVIARDKRYSDSDYDYLDAALDICSALLAASYDDTNPAQTLMSLWVCDWEDMEITMSPSAPEDVCGYIITTYVEPKDGERSPVDPFGTAALLIRNACDRALEHEGGMNDTEHDMLVNIRRTVS
jgi:hypothetical protein